MPSAANQHTSWQSLIRCYWTLLTEQSANPAARVQHYIRTISTSTQNTSIWSLTATVPSDGVFRALCTNLLTISPNELDLTLWGHKDWHKTDIIAKDITDGPCSLPTVVWKDIYDCVVLGLCLPAVERLTSSRITWRSENRLGCQSTMTVMWFLKCWRRKGRDAGLSMQILCIKCNIFFVFHTGFPRLLENPGFFPKISRPWKVLENEFDRGKSWKLKFKVLEFTCGSTYPTCLLCIEHKMCK